MWKRGALTLAKRGSWAEDKSKKTGKGSGRQGDTLWVGD